MNISAFNFYIITGGPGVGKTTLLNELADRGYTVVPEIARRLIQEQQLKNGDALPWKDKEQYQQLMFDQSVQSFKNTYAITGTCETVFFDRGFIDALCYAKIINLAVDRYKKEAVDKYRYNKTAFILPPWQEIYTQDEQRKQNWQEVEETHRKMMATYQGYGYDLMEIPKATPSFRADFVLEHIKKINK